MVIPWSILGRCCLEQGFCDFIDSNLEFEDPPRRFDQLHHFRWIIQERSKLPVSRWEIKELERILKSKDISLAMNAIRRGWRNLKPLPRSLQFNFEYPWTFTSDWDWIFCSAIGLACIDSKFRKMIEESKGDNIYFFSLPWRRGGDLRRLLNAEVRFKGNTKTVRRIMELISQNAWDPPDQAGGTSAFKSSCSAGATGGEYLHVNQPQLESYLRKNEDLEKLLRKEGIVI